MAESATEPESAVPTDPERTHWAAVHGPRPDRVEVRAPTPPAGSGGGAYGHVAPPVRGDLCGPDGDYPALGRYRLLNVLGGGGMGVVYHAWDPLVGREVAVKVLGQEIAKDPECLARFLDEARAAGKLNHPNAVSVYEIGHDGKTHFLVLEYLPGGSVADLLERGGALGWEEATRLVTDACRGLAAAHAVGLVHRDVKPANVLLTRDRRAKVADFGLARCGDGRAVATNPGQVLGTPLYMSPEQCRGEWADARSDVYSLGATYYALLAGGPAYADAGTSMQIMFAHCQRPVPDPREHRPEVPENVAAVVGRAMQKNPGQRHPDAAALLAELEALGASRGDTSVFGTIPALAGPAPPARRGSASAMQWASLGLTLSVLALVLWSPWARQPAYGRPDRAAYVPGDAPALAGPAEPPILVGTLHSLTGPMAACDAPIADATQFAVEELNAAGGLLGRQVQAVVADGASDDATIVREAERLVTRDRVAVLVGGSSSSARRSLRPVLERHDHLLLYPHAHEGLEDAPHVFYLGGAPNHHLEPAAAWAFAFADARRPAIVGGDTLYGRAGAAILGDRAKALGMTVVATEFAAPDGGDAEAMVARLAAAKPDCLFNLLAGDANVAFFRRWRAAGMTAARTPTVSFRLGTAELRLLGPRVMAGEILVGSYFDSLATEENHAFLRRLRQRFTDLRSAGDATVAAYVGVHLWADAVRAAGTTDPAAVRAALAGRQFLGPAGMVALDPGNRHLHRPVRVARVEPDGSTHVLFDGGRPEAPRPFPATRTRAEWDALLDGLRQGWGGKWERTAR